MHTNTEQLNHDDFWQKLSRFGYRAGSEIVEKALWLFYAARRPETPVWARSVIVGALAYFVLPTDALPDFVPGIGYTDDLSVLATAVGAVALFINDDVKRKTEEVLQKWFPKRHHQEATEELKALPKLPH